MKNEFKLRLQSADVAPNKNPNHKNVAKVFIHQSVFLQAGFVTGGPCQVEAGTVRKDAVAWPQPDKNVANSIVSVSRAFQQTLGLDLGEVVRVTAGAGDVAVAGPVVLRDTTPDMAPVPVQVRVKWLAILESKLEGAEYIFPGMTFGDQLFMGTKRSFVVESVNGGTHTVGKYTPVTTVLDLVDAESSSAGSRRSDRLEAGDIPGLKAQLAAFHDDFLADYGVDFTGYTVPLVSCGVVLHGSHGTGKTLFLERIAASHWGRVVRFEGDIKPAAIKDHFRTALDSASPTVILIDDLADLVGSGPERSSRPAVVGALADGLDSLAERAAAQNRRPDVVVVATCLDYLTEVPRPLQKFTRFRKHIALPVPDVDARREIIRWHKPRFSPDVNDDYVTRLSDRTHAYTGEDIKHLLASATEAYRTRIRSLPPAKAQEGEGEGYLEHYLEWEDVQKGLHEVRPTAMHDIDLKPPTVRWTDIGGYESVKRSLQKALRRPGVSASTNSSPRRTVNLSVPKKGILLYGPPGCSKTMTAQAMATESGFNFFAVKGGELLNMYVGETERAIRNLFRRAREASPSIVFFDEIDSIAGTRSSSSSSSSSSGGGGGGVQALTTLLTEMDGFEKLGDVFVLAATNKPDALDPALLRPGRFDRLVYVPLPDRAARRAILASRARALRFAGVTEADLDRLSGDPCTGGYSGAEIAAICGEACDDLDDLEDQGEAERADVVALLEGAVRGTPRRVTPDVLRQFETWHRSLEGGVWGGNGNGNGNGGGAGGSGVFTF